LKLAYKFYPLDKEKQSLIEVSRNLLILHGLFGSSKNWVTLSKALSSEFNVYSLDLRNHGDSPHSDVHTIEAMSSDIEEFISEHNLQNLSLLGHSMGGLVAMYFDLTHPKLLESLVIQDISPRSYPFTYDNEIESMQIDLTNCNSRSEIDLLMKEKLPDTFIRQFLQMNLDRTEDGKYFWKLNVEGINHSRRMFSDSFQNLKPSETKTLFVLGGDSEYINSKDHEIILALFPLAKFQTIPGGGHYIHYTHAKEFTPMIQNFLSRA